MTQATVDNRPAFGKIRSYLWPIYNYELKKLLPMLFMFFFISFNYSILRNLKDAFVINAAGSPGAEILPFLKFWFVIPGAVLFMIIFAKLSNKFEQEKLFYVTISPFIIFFALFWLVLYPAKEMLHMPNLKISFIPDGMTATIRIWTFSLFYTLAELWGSVVLGLLFWAFANATTKISEAKRFYALFGIGANGALIAAGYLTSLFSSLGSTPQANVDPMQVTLNYIIPTYLVSSLLIIAIYRWINKNVLTDPRFYDPTQVKKKKSKPKMSLKESFLFLVKSKYLMYIAILVIAYGISINLIEVIWKDKLKLFIQQSYPIELARNQYLAFMGKYSMATGITTIFLMLFVSSNLLRKLGWTFTALVTPVMILITGAIFFMLVIFNNVFDPMIIKFGGTALFIAVIVGTIQNVLSKGAKYSMFDPTKEMSYIPLDEESKIKGKAAIDVVGSRLGKAGGSVILQLLLPLGGGILSGITPYLAIVVFFVVGIWTISTYKLGKEFAEKSKGLGI